MALHGRRLTYVLASHKNGNCLPFYFLFYVSLHPSGDVDELRTSVDSVFSFREYDMQPNVVSIEIRVI